MSQTNIPNDVTLRLWVMAGGRCEYEGCNDILWRDDLTLTKMNAAYRAHIVSDSPDGPRGDAVESPRLATSLSNLMLLCDVHHRLIDREQVGEHPRERLEEMKKAHELRIETLTGIKIEKRTEILLYGANVGQHASPVNFQGAVEAIVPDRYPAAPRPIELGMTNSALRDDADAFWASECANLKSLFVERVAPQFAAGSLPHLSVFALAPQPLLVLLGALISNIPDADVFTRMREPQTWKWEADGPDEGVELRTPAGETKQVALVLSLSADVVEDRVQKVLGQHVHPWFLRIRKPRMDFLRSKSQLVEIRAKLREALAQIKTVHGEDVEIHVFPAAPPAVAVELGRVWMPKADLNLVLYDQNEKAGGFVRAFDLRSVLNGGGGTT